MCQDAVNAVSRPGFGAACPLQQIPFPVEQAFAPHFGHGGRRIFLHVRKETVSRREQFLPFGGDIQRPAGINPDVAAVLPRPEGFAHGAEEGFVGFDAQQAETADAHGPVAGKHDAKRQGALRGQGQPQSG